MALARLSGMTVVVLLVWSTSMAANRVVIQSTTVPTIDCFTGVVNISIESDVDLSSFSIPLVARSILGTGAFWTTIERRPSAGRLANTLSNIQSLEVSRADFTSPDQIALYFEAAGPGDCMLSGGLEIMTGLNFQNNHIPGAFEIDTAMYAPSMVPHFTACVDQSPIFWDEFTKGTIDVVGLPPGGCNAFLQFDSTTLTAWAGAVLSNDADYIDPEGDQNGFRLLSGPGSLDSNTGAWVWNSAPADSGEFEIVIATHRVNCPTDQCLPKSFTVTLKGLVPGDINCDGVVDVLDVVTEVGQAFRNDPAPTPCWDL